MDAEANNHINIAVIFTLVFICTNLIENFILQNYWHEIGKSVTLIYLVTIDSDTEASWYLI